MSRTEAWLVNAFCSERAAGNVTGVVFPPGDADGTWCHEVAKALRAPDTAFLWDDAGGHRARFFSPAEGEMAMCGQGLIACDAVLRARGASGPLRIRSQVGELVCESFEGKSWLRFPRESVTQEPNRLVLALSREVEGRAQVVDSGRRRAFLELPLDAMERLTLPASHVMHACRELSLAGLCFYARTGEAELHFRVFTVSLEGREDASTGGAVVGLAPLLEKKPEWRIEQGSGSRFSRGTLFLRDQPEGVLVGGEVQLVLKGDLAFLSPSGRGSG